MFCKENICATVQVLRKVRNICRFGHHHRGEKQNFMSTEGNPQPMLYNSHSVQPDQDGNKTRLKYSSLQQAAHRDATLICPGGYGEYCILFAVGG